MIRLQSLYAWPEMPDPKPTTTLRPVEGPTCHEEYLERSRERATKYRAMAKKVLAYRNAKNGITTSQ